MTTGANGGLTLEGRLDECRTEVLGVPFVYPARSVIGTLLDHGFAWDEILRPIVDALLPEPSPAIADVGANIGASLRQMLAARPLARIVAFEPSGRFLPFLRRNVAALGRPDVRIVPKALGPASGVTWLYTGYSTGGVVWAGPDDAGGFARELVEVTTLDEAIPAELRLDFLKIDVDGFDFEVLRGARRVLARDRPALFVEFVDSHLARPIEDLEWLARQGYPRLAVLSPSPGGRLLGVTGDPREVIAWSRRHGYVDLLAASPGTVAAERLADLLGSSLARARPAAERATTIAYSKPCEVEDFVHPDLVGTIREIFAHETIRFGPGFPAGVEYRKHWEIAMAVRALDDLGALRPDARILGVGAGTELTTFHLAHRVAEVVATDLYSARGIWSREAPLRALYRAREFAPFRFDADRVRILDMDARRLEFADGVFDGIFSSSSLEHFGTLDDVEAAIREMSRVLRPGGVLTLATEVRLDGGDGWRGSPGCLIFDGETLRRRVIEASGLDLVGPLDLRVSARTLASAWPLRDHVAARERWLAANPNAPRWQEPVWEHYPHVAIGIADCLFGSVHLALRKSASARRPRPVRLSPAPAPREHRVRAVGLFDLAGGLTEAQDRLLAAAEAAGAPLDRIDVRTAAHEPVPPVESRRGAPLPVSLVTAALPIVALIGAVPAARLTRGDPTIAYWFWESSVLSEGVVRAVPLADEIWVASEYNRAVLSRYTTAPIRVLPVPLVPIDARADRRRFGIPEDRHVFLASSSIRSFVPRKNPFGPIRAFTRAFGRSRAGGPMLVVKLQHASDDPALVARIRGEVEAIGGRLVAEDLTRGEMDHLLASADVHVSLHRAEGFGLGMAESMVLGRPVIATDYSGSVDFVREANGYPVRFATRPVLPEDVVDQPFVATFFPIGSDWAEPDLDDAARAMTRSFEDPDEARAKGERARRDVLAHCDAARIGRLAAEALARRAGAIP